MLIRRLAAEGVPKSRIAERLGISRTTLLKAVATKLVLLPPRDPESKGVVEIHYLAAALKAPRITEPAARLADHATVAGWTRLMHRTRASIALVSDACGAVRLLRPDHVAEQ